MPSTQSYISFVEEQLLFVPHLRIKKMFGEYAIYKDKLFFGIIANDQLFLKRNDYLVKTVGDDGVRAYDGSKNTIRIPAEMLDDKPNFEEMVLTYLSKF